MNDRPDADTPRSRGRPRSGDIDMAVGKAVWELLDEIGYEGLTFDAVAERAGCSRPALYRRWPSKRVMVLEVIHGLIEITATARPVTPGKGVEAIYGWLRGLIDFLSGSGRGALLSLSHVRRRDSDLAAALDRIVSEDRVKFVVELRLLLGPDISEARLQRMIDAMIGAIFFRVSLQDLPMSDEELRALVAEQIAGARAAP